MLTTGWDGLGRLKKDSTGSYAYTEAEREAIYKHIGEQKLYKKLIPLMNNSRYNKELKLLRAHRATGDDLENERIKLKTQQLPLFQKLDKIIRDAQLLAEREILSEKPDVLNTIIRQQVVDKKMKQGDVMGARKQQQKELEERNQLLQYGGKR